MQSVKFTTLSQFRGSKAKPSDDISFPRVGRTDADVFGINLLEVMQNGSFISNERNKYSEGENA